jgi:hypothetical protein
MAAVALQDELPSHPLDLIEHIAGARDWMIERAHEDEVNMVVAGSWCDLQLSLNWHPEMEGLHLACTFDIKVPATRHNEVIKVISLINGQLLFGHFDFWQNDGTLLFRHSVMLTGGANVSPEQCDSMLAMALKNAERYYPVFQFVIWAGKTAPQAMQASLLETQGEA